MRAARLHLDSLQFLDWAPLDLEVAAGETVGISGSSGSGKSLLLRAVADLDDHRGEVTLDGVPATQFAPSEWRRSVALLPAESRWWHPTVGEHFESLPRALAAELGFEPDVFTWPVERLSVGERQRLALARVLDRSPRVLLLDEPTANLDADATRRLESVVARTALTTLWVSHDPGQLARAAQRAFRMEGKQLRPADRGGLQS